MDLPATIQLVFAIENPIPNKNVAYKFKVENWVNLYNVNYKCFDTYF
jgi:hypothetical protein